MRSREVNSVSRGATGSGDVAGRVRVTYLQRKTRPAANFSVEQVFDDVRRRLAPHVDATVVTAAFMSNGVLRRALNVLHAALAAQGVNHVTGDISYVGLLLPRSRTVQTLLDVGHLDRTTGIRQWILKKLWLEWPLSRCAVATVISEATKREVLKYVPDCPPEKLRVVPVAIADEFRPDPRPFNEAWPTVLQVGTAPNKNIERLLEALEGLSCRLVVIGKRRPELEANARHRRITVDWREGLSLPEVIKCYREADLVCLASTYEGFGMPIVEGQTIGRPVVTSRLLSMPEVGGDGACYVDPFDPASIRAAIERIVSDRVYREQLIAAGFRNAQRFDADAIARAYLSIYRELAGPRTPIGSEAP